MAKKLYEETSVQNIADAIREKNGSTSTYTIGEMSEAISNLTGGVAGVSSVNGQTGDVTITAEGLGALTEDDLQEATDAALAQAKASGEFDGAQGPKGDTGAQGETGPAGAGLDVTGAAVGQIVKIAAVDGDGVPTAWSPVDMPSGGTWGLLATLDASTADVFEVDFEAPMQEIFYRSQICDTAGEQYAASTTVYRTLSYKTGGAWKSSTLKLGACRHVWRYTSNLYLNAQEDFAYGFEWEVLTQQCAAGVFLPGKATSKTYTAGHIEGIEIVLTVPEGTENTATGIIQIWGVKA